MKSPEAGATLSEPGEKRVKERKRMLSDEMLAKMPLEELLYYVLVGDGSKQAETVAG